MIQLQTGTWLAVAAMLAAGPQLCAGQNETRPAGVAVTKRGTSTRPAASQPLARGSRQPSKPASDDEVCAALGRIIPEVTHVNTPLGQVMRDFRRRLGVNVHLQAQQLDDNGIDLDRLVTFTLKRLPAARVLELILAEVGGEVPLAYDVLDGVLVISLAEALGRHKVNRTYWAGDLITGTTGRSAPRPREEQRRHAYELLEIIEQTVAPDSWVDNGGEASIDEHDAVFVVHNNPAAHRQIEALLRALRNVPKGGSAWIPPQPTNEVSANEAIHKALRRILPIISYEDTPFLTVIDHLRRHLDINIHTFTAELEDQGVEADKPVTMHLKNVTAERLLRQVLADIGGDVRLAFEVRDGVLLIASAEFLDRRLSIRVYDIGDVGTTARARERLLSVLMDTVEPDSWIDNGGAAPGLLFNTRLVVSQNPRAHRMIESLLHQLRQHKLGNRRPGRP